MNNLSHYSQIVTYHLNQNIKGGRIHTFYEIFHNSVISVAENSPDGVATVFKLQLLPK